MMPNFSRRQRVGAALDRQLKTARCLFERCFSLVEGLVQLLHGGIHARLELVPGLAAGGFQFCILFGGRFLLRF